MRLVLLLLVSVFFLGKPVSAQGIYTHGKIDCGGWIKGRGTDESIINEVYLIGLINGLALGKQKEFWHANGIEVSPAQVFLWMDKYCRDEPLSNPITGVFRLFDERT